MKFKMISESKETDKLYKAISDTADAIDDLDDKDEKSAKKNLDSAHEFYEKHGGKAIIIARFVPIIRTFIPFVAGIGKMSYAKFLSYNIIGAAAWVSLFTIGGYFFGNLPFVEKNFSIVILAIIVFSIMPGFITYLREKRKNPV